MAVQPGANLPELKLTILHLYPTLMNVYGDRGNIITLLRRCEWRGIQAEVLEGRRGERLDAASFDLVFFGGGQDQEQSAVGQDLVATKSEVLQEAVENGATVLAICGGYQLLGRYFKTRSGEEIPGIGLFDAWTIAGDRRNIGNVVVSSTLNGQERTLVGFENHSGKTYLGPGCEPLGQVIVGAGNNGEDRSEGARYKNAFGCYLHGPVLPKNSWFADELIRRALQRRYGPEIKLPPLDDRLENLAHATVARRAERLRNQRSGAW